VELSGSNGSYTPDMSLNYRNMGRLSARAAATAAHRPELIISSTPTTSTLIIARWIEQNHKTVRKYRIFVLIRQCNLTVPTLDPFNTSLTVFKVLKGILDMVYLLAINPPSLID